jgi:hypothetical protein
VTVTASCVGAAAILGLVTDFLKFAGVDPASRKEP